MDTPWSWRFLLLAPPPTWWWWAVSSYPGGNRGGRGWLFPSVYRRAGRYFERVVTFRRGRHLLSASPLPFFPAKLIPLNLMGCIIGSSCYWAYAIHFWAFPQSTYCLTYTNTILFLDQIWSFFFFANNLKWAQTIHEIIDFKIICITLLISD
jgi:hypothetical protein